MLDIFCLLSVSTKDLYFQWEFCTKKGNITKQDFANFTKKHP